MPIYQPKETQDPMSISPMANNPFWKNLTGKCILVVGAGKTGCSAIRYLNSMNCTLVIWDSRTTITIEDLPIQNSVTLLTGENATINWLQIDGVVLSPGVAPSISILAPAYKNNLPVIGDIELFALNVATTSTTLGVPLPKIIGVTGSNGKTTVTLLIEHLLRSAAKKVIAAGNIGEPALDLLLLTKSDFPEYIVLELSSFQLEMTSSLSLDVACYLNVSEDHLDRHGNYEHYAYIKQRIYNNAKAVVYWHDQALTHPNPSSTIKNHHAFSVKRQVHSVWSLNDQHDICFKQTPIVNTCSSSLAGLHNILNIQAAIATIYQLGLYSDNLKSALDNFTPAAHRCITVFNKRSVQWIDDSKATNPGATLAALEGIGPTVTGNLILIAGGDAKGADLSVLETAMKTYVKTVITIGKDADLFNGLTPSRVKVDSLELAVKLASDLACDGDIVLLSPACASIDMFKNYVHRAEVFANAIERWEG